jgi:hypothetical protein
MSIPNGFELLILLLNIGCLFILAISIGFCCKTYKLTQRGKDFIRQMTTTNSYDDTTHPSQYTNEQINLN